jgi:serine/threonine protein kinase
MSFENWIYDIGQTIEIYTVKDILGRGSYGQVYKIEWKTREQITRAAAVKVFNDLVFKNIIKETSIWASVGKHDNILSLTRADIIDSRVWLFSEYIADGSLRKWLDINKAQDFSYRDYIPVMMGILRGLDYLHKNGIVHRDLKPANILLKRKLNDSSKLTNFCPVLADFGLARNLDLIETDARIGTPLYSSPELHSASQGDRECTKHDDLWAVCVIFQELLTGEKPFLEIKDIMNCSYSELPLVFPAELRNLFRKQFQIDKSKRFKSTSEMVLELERIAKKLNIELAEESNFVSEIPADNADETVADPNQAKKYFELAMNCKKGDNDCCILYYTKAIDINPNFHVAYNNRGLAYMNKNDYVSAINDFSEAIKIRKSYTTAYNNRGTAYYHLEKYKQSIKDYQEAIKLNPDYADAHNNLGNAYARLKNYKEAIKNYKKALELDPDDKDFQQNLKTGYMNLKKNQNQ